MTMPRKPSKPTAKPPAVKTGEPAVAKKATTTARPVRARPASPTAVAATPTRVPKRNEAPASAGKPAKEKKPKLVRDSFTMPKTEYTVIDSLKVRAAALASPSKKSELLRAGIKALARMADAEFVAALGAVPTLKTGRPKQGRT